jgi:aldehyde dehydrogenase (NAD+)
MTGHRRYRMLIDGQWLGASDGATFDSINPATEGV